MSDLIDRQQAIDAVCMEWCGVKHQDCEHPFDVENDDYYWCDGCETVLQTLPDLPPAQPEKDREFIKLAVRNSNGRPYYSIIYLEFDDNGVGHDFEGYSSYSLDVISDYLKKYFMPPAQPERIKGHWIAMENKNLFRCSECDAVIYSESERDRNEFHKFCGRCGADMREVTE